MIRFLLQKKTMDSIITEESTMTLLRRRLLRADRGLNRKDTLTITIERKNFEEAKAQFATLEATIHKIPLSIMQKKH